MASKFPLPKITPNIISKIIGEPDSEKVRSYVKKGGKGEGGSSQP